MSNAVPQVPDTKLPMTGWSKAKIAIASIIAVISPYLLGRTALAVRVLENRDFAHSFKDGTFAAAHDAHHEKYTTLKLSDGIGGVAGFLKNRFVLEKNMAKEFKDSNISRWEALNNLSVTQKAAGLFFVGVGIVGLGMVLWPSKKQQAPQTEQNSPPQEDTESQKSFGEAVVKKRAGELLVLER